MIEKRCSNCNALLAKAFLQNGKVEIKCRCGTKNIFEAATEIKKDAKTISHLKISSVRITA